MLFFILLFFLFPYKGYFMTTPNNEFGQGIARDEHSNTIHFNNNNDPFISNFFMPPWYPIYRLSGMNGPTGNEIENNFPDKRIFLRKRYENDNHPHYWGDRVAKYISSEISNHVKHLMLTGVFGGKTLMQIKGSDKSYLLNKRTVISCRSVPAIDIHHPFTCEGEIIQMGTNPCVPGTNYIQIGNTRCYGNEVKVEKEQCIIGTPVTIDSLKRRCSTAFDTDSYAQYTFMPLPGPHPGHGHVDCENNYTADHYCNFTGNFV